jgi:integrase
VFPRKVDAENHVIAMQHSKLSGTYIDPTAGKVTFKTYAEEWRDRQVWRASTAEAMRYAIERANTAFGNKAMASIRQSDVQKFVRGLTDAELAPATVEASYRAASMVFRAAVVDRVIPASPCVSIRLPAIHRPKVKPLEPAQVQALANTIAPRLRGLVLFTAGSGLRISEVIGLTRDRVDFLRKTLRVDRQLVDVVEGEPVFGPPKTKASSRVVPIGQATVDVLAAHLAAYPAEPEALIFTNDDGEPWRRNRVSAAWGQARSTVKITDAKIHDLRHYFASVLIGAGCSIKAVQEALGHANASETLDTYSHLWPADEDRIRDAIDKAFASPVGATKEAEELDAVHA